jgi:RNA 3'-terminal phosphate cyclase
MINVLVAPYKSIEVETEEDGNQILSEGQKITFVTEGDGIVKKGIITGFKGSKPEKVEIEIIPSGENHKEIWKVIDMIEGSLKLIEDE